MELRLVRPKDYFRRGPVLLGELKAWKAGLIDVLKKSPSKDRKILKLNVIRMHPQPDGYRHVREVLESEELEVSPESFP